MARAGRKPVRKLQPTFILSVQYAMAADGLPSRQRMRSWAKAALQTDAQEIGRAHV